MRVWSRLKDWYQGPYIEPKNEPGSGLVFVMGYHEQPPLAKLLGVLGRFWLAYWQWIIGTALAVVAIWVSL